MAGVTLWDLQCLKHGGLEHAAVHEAGHAVGAIVLGLTFVEISVDPHPSEPWVDGGGLVGGGLRFESAEVVADIVAKDPVGSLQMFLAGVRAEIEVFGDQIKDSHVPDLNLWRTYAGLRGAPPPRAFEAFLGTSFRKVDAATVQLLQQRSALVISVAEALMGRWRLDYDEVRDIVLAEP